MCTFTSSKGLSSELKTMPAVPAETATETRSGCLTSVCCKREVVQPPLLDFGAALLQSWRRNR